MSLRMTYGISLSGGNQFYQNNTQPIAAAKSSLEEVVPDGSTDLALAISAENGTGENAVKALARLAECGQAPRCSSPMPVGPIPRCLWTSSMIRLPNG